jgi:hypothetical protein
MKGPARLIVLVATALSVCLMLPSFAAAGLSQAAFDKALDRVFAQGYPQALEDFITSQGNDPQLGYRLAGSPAELAVMRRVVKEFQASGLVGVRKEWVPVDVVSQKASSVTAGGTTYLASAAGGPPATGAAGLNADLVYVGDGSKAAFDAVEAVSGSVAGKIVLVDVDMAAVYDYVNILGAEAYERGVAGVIITDSGHRYAHDDAIGTLFESYMWVWPPMVYLSKTGGDALRPQVQAAMTAHEAFAATLLVDSDITLSSAGGHAYNVIGTLPGKSHTQPIVMSAHMDGNAWTGMDDAAALSNMLAVAKAMHASGYRPAHDIIFYATTAEEFGHTNTWFDYLGGSWYASTHTHTDWKYKVRAFIGYEWMAMKDEPLKCTGSEEIVSLLTRVAAENPTLVPYGAKFAGPVNSWNDSWPFAAEGVPGMSFTAAGAYGASVYHTNYETKALVDFDYLELIGKFIFRVQKALDTSCVLPYDFAARADAVAGSADADELLGAGADAEVVSRLSSSIAGFTNAAERFNAKRGSIKDVPAANGRLVEIASLLSDKLTALDAWGMTCYPHQHLLWDIEYINATIAELEKSPVDPDAATAPLWNVSQMYYGLTYDYAAFLDDQARWALDYPYLYWGGQGQLAPQLDLVAEYHLVQAGDYSVARARLARVRANELALLNARLAALSQVLQAATRGLNALSAK